MKLTRLPFVFILLLASASLKAQDLPTAEFGYGTAQVKFSAEWMIIDDDTTWRFSVTTMDYDIFRERMVNKIGGPTLNMPGYLTWDKQEMSELGESNTIRVRDGLMTTKNKKGIYKPFADEKEMRKDKWKSNQSRRMVIELFDDNNERIITTREKMKLALDYLVMKLE